MKPEKILPELALNQPDDSASGRKLSLIRAYWVVYEALHSMRFGGGLRTDLKRQLRGASFPLIEHEGFAEPELFARLARASAARTIRIAVNQSRWLGKSSVGKLLLEQPEVFLAIKRDPRFPRSSERQMEFFARGIASAMLGYELTTGIRYLGHLVKRCVNCNEPARMLGREGLPWCGDC